MVNIWPGGTLEKAVYWIPDKLAAEYGKVLREEFVLKPRFRNHAENLMTQLKTSVKSSKEVLFVSIHVRRTDYQDFSKKVLKKKTVGKSYYREAMEYFREEFPNNKIFFLALSDDMSWVRRHLSGAGDLVLAGSEGGSEEERVGQDLAVMANCHHTIVSNGMFGMWGSHLAGGETYTEYGVMAGEVMRSA